MRSAPRALALLVAVVAIAPPAWAQSVLTLSDVLNRARTQAPAVLAGRLALDEARARLAGASLRVTANPELDLAIGNRSGFDARSTDLEVGFSQSLEPGARRSARVAGANAAIDRSSASLEETTRLVLRASAAAFYRALHANERARLLTTAEEIAGRVHQAASRRYQAGDIAILDVNIARAALARVRADRQAAVADAAVATGELRSLLGIREDVRVQGSLADTPAPLVNLQEAALQRAELRELEAAIREAEADLQLGQSFQKPEFGIGARYEREASDQIVKGGITLSLPVFAKGQELRATGLARSTRLRAELEAARARVTIEVAAAQQAAALRQDAVRILEAEALPGLDENDTLATRSFEAGQIGLPDLLLIRREILDTRLQYLDTQLDAAIARIELLTTAGVLR